MAEAKVIEVTLRLNDSFLEDSNLRKEMAECKRAKANLEKSIQERDRLLGLLREKVDAKDSQIEAEKSKRKEAEFQKKP